MLKNPQTAGHAAARALVSDRKVALTGTPVENRLTDAWALFDLVLPGLLGNQRAFVRDYRNPIEKHGDAEAKARLARKLKPFLLRRTKDAVAVDLPAKSIVPLTITLGAAQMELHESQRGLVGRPPQLPPAFLVACELPHCYFRGLNILAGLKTIAESAWSTSSAKSGRIRR
ncbi:SNF2-related protein [Sphingomonas abietis]|uniref:SNF2-related protein n=1 Tax=Sphingomonas abietis TaxID=3012344 RepID=A0ABY7NSM4_9SPHN|nr:SNF2-related protein [Sphingomonas abietis]WBO24378.1 SNF2-related protein [Sphingomonas abietis]